MDVLLKIREEGAVAIRESDWKRFIKAARELDSPSSNYLAAAWALLGIAVTVGVGAITLPAYAVSLLIAAISLLLVSGLCYGFHRDINGKRQRDGERLARELEEAGDMERLPPVDRPGANPAT